MQLDKSAIAVLQKYRIVGASGKVEEISAGVNPDTHELTDLPRQRNAIVPGDQYVVPRMAPEALAAFLSAALNAEWLDWMLFQAAGGKQMVDKSEKYIEDQINYVVNSVSTNLEGHRLSDKEVIPYIEDRKEADAYVRKVYGAELDELKQNLDPDILLRMSPPGSLFGIWPWLDGKKFSNRVSNEEVIETVNTFKASAEAVKSYNKENQEQVNPDLTGYKAVAEVQAVTEKVSYYHKARYARQDIAYDQVYTDENVNVIAPLTYAAAVSYGWDSWAYANRSQFEELLSTPGMNKNAWRDLIRQGYLVVFMTIQRAAPRYVAGRPKKHAEPYEEIYSLGNLAIEIPLAGSTDPDEFSIYDESADKNIRWKWSQIIKAVKGEPARAKEQKSLEVPGLLAEPPREYGAEEEERKYKAGVLGSQILAEPVSLGAGQPANLKAYAEYSAYQLLIQGKNPEEVKAYLAQQAPQTLADFDPEAVQEFSGYVDRYVKEWTKEKAVPKKTAKVESQAEAAARSMQKAMKAIVAWTKSSPAQRIRADFLETRPEVRPEVRPIRGRIGEPEQA